MIGESGPSGSISSIWLLGVSTKHTRTPCAGRSNGSRTTSAPIRSRYMATDCSIDGVATPTWFNRPSFICDVLKRDIVVFLPRIFELLVAQLAEAQRHPPPGRMRHDHLVDIAAVGGHERVGEPLLIFLGPLGNLGRVALLLA